MNAEEFRMLALSLPEAIEGAHMRHPDFRVGGKIFATLQPDEKWGVVMLTPNQQTDFVTRDPATFVAAKGSWGQRGCTQVLLNDVKVSSVKNALKLAWTNKAPKKLLARVDVVDRE
jgi:hypothetical protein